MTKASSPGLPPVAWPLPCGLACTGGGIHNQGGKENSWDKEVRKPIPHLHINLQIFSVKPLLWDRACLSPLTVQSGIHNHGNDMEPRKPNPTFSPLWCLHHPIKADNWW